MANHITLTITLKKVVADDAEAIALTAIVKQKLADQPSVKVTSHTIKEITE